MHPQRKPLMVGNWKMYKTAREAESFVQKLIELLKPLSLKDLPDIVICPPFTALKTVCEIISKESLPLSLGAQNMESHDEGAFTGEISPLMLREFQVNYAIIGHSERRQYFNETDERVNAKIGSALKYGITPIVCVGESLEQREAGQTDSWIEKQVKVALRDYSDSQKENIVFAYEPIWAIGTGKVCDPVEANRVIALIKEISGVPGIRVRVLYGGSVKPDNIEAIMSQPAIGGGLVGGASLDPESFFKLIRAAMPLNV